jgi:hypothetical protein
MDKKEKSRQCWRFGLPLVRGGNEIVVRQASAAVTLRSCTSWGLVIGVGRTTER